MAVPDSSWYENELRCSNDRLSAAFERSENLSKELERWKAMHSAASEKERLAHLQNYELKEAIANAIPYLKVAQLHHPTEPKRDMIRHLEGLATAGNCVGGNCEECGALVEHLFTKRCSRCYDRLVAGMEKPVGMGDFCPEHGGLWSYKCPWCVARSAQGKQFCGCGLEVTDALHICKPAQQPPQGQIETVKHCRCVAAPTATLRQHQLGCHLYGA